MRNEVKREIEDLANKAVLAWNHYRSLCEEIGRKLTLISDEPIFDVMYQPGDGIVVGVDEYEHPLDAPLNIPIEQFLEG